MLPINVSITNFVLVQYWFDCCLVQSCVLLLQCFYHAMLCKCSICRLWVPVCLLLSGIVLKVLTLRSIFFHLIIPAF